jgi:glycine cleavage system H lipoate-binding protein
MENANAPQSYFQRSLEEFFKPLMEAPLPNDRKYNRGHLWIKSDSATTATIGLDHIGAYFLRPVVSVVLPQTPCRVEHNSPCAWLALREGTIPLRPALSGVGIEANTDLVDHPYLLLDDPYSSGWILRVIDAVAFDAGLLHADEFSHAVTKEMTAMKEKFTSAFNKLLPAVGTTMYDGGEPVKSIHEILGRKKYYEIISRLFSKA